MALFFVSPNKSLIPLASIKAITTKSVILKTGETIKYSGKPVFREEYGESNEETNELANLNVTTLQKLLVDMKRLVGYVDATKNDVSRTNQAVLDSRAALKEATGEYAREIELIKDTRRKLERELTHVASLRHDIERVKGGFNELLEQFEEEAADQASA